ncbi:hypothetical protein BOX15_Mlig020954g1 [Macrostomum lignano]|uniref:BTB domain-containing protein n=2 Tax=Macrostomum lignano TaxID=282301 RepID=A0A267FQZ9_9PLAT|nr:hypothetical protein BOX15_Mlig020954g1 [Macrostomum lignano]
MDSNRSSNISNSGCPTALANHLQSHSFAPTNSSVVSSSNSSSNSGSSHAAEMLSKMNELRKRDCLCDVDLLVEDEVFPAHRIVLASCSDYFCAMFTGGMEESDKSSVEIKGVKADVMSELLNFVYTESVAVCMDNVQDLLPAASLLQLEGVTAACCEFLKSELHPSNVLGVTRFAELHSCHQLQQAAQLFSSRHFEDVIKEEEFWSISCQELLELVKREDLQVDSEESVYQAVMRWVRYDELGRAGDLPDLLSHIRLATLSARFITEVLDQEPLVQERHQCRDLLDAAKRYHLRPDLRHEMTEAKYRPRSGADEYMVLIGGFGKDQAPIDSVELFNPRTGNWSGLTPLPKRYRYVAAAAIKSTIYAIGGFDGRERLNAVSCLDLQDPSPGWRSITPMRHKRGLSAAASYQGRIFVCGGFDGSVRLRSLEVYDPKIDEWRLLQDMATPREGAGLLVADNALFCMGGYDGAHLLSSMERYDPKRGNWSHCEPMRMRRSGSGCAVVADTIYVCGGYGGADGQQPVHLDSVEAYHIRQGQWSSIVCMNIPRCYVGACHLNGKIFVAAGYDGTQLLSSVEAFDPIRNEWLLHDEAASCMIYGRCDTGMCVVRLK